MALVRRDGRSTLRRDGAMSISLLALHLQPISLVAVSAVRTLSWARVRVL